MRKPLSASLASIVLGALISTAPTALAQYTISTFAGGGPPPTPVAGLSASIGQVLAVAADPAGNVYFSSGLCVFRLDRDGIMTRIAGNCRAGFSGDGGPATEAQLSAHGLAFDAAGNLYIADGANGRVRKVANGTITTVAGIGIVAPVPGGGDGGPATSAPLNFPRGVAVDSAGNLYIAEWEQGGGLRKVLPDGTITTIGKNDIGFPYGVGGVAVDSARNIFLTEPEYDRVRKISPGGLITSVAIDASYPQGLAVDSAGNLYVADHDNNRIAKVAPNGAVTTVAGSGQFFGTGYSGDGGPATSAMLAFPYGVAADSAGNLYIADSGNKRVRKVSSGIITTIAGNGSENYSGDGGSASQAQLGGPSGAAFDSARNLYFADLKNNRIRRISPDGTINTVAGNGIPGFSGDGGRATDAQLNFLSVDRAAVAVDAAGNLYVADVRNSRIRKISPDGIITTAVATQGQDVAVDTAGNIFLAESGSIRKISPAGVITILAQGNGPLAVDSSDNLYFSANAYPNYGIRRISPSGATTSVWAGGGTGLYSGGISGLALDPVGGVYFASVTSVFKVSSAITADTIGGNGNTGYSGDGGPALSAQLNVSGLAVDSLGNVYVTDSADNVIRLLKPSQPIVLPAPSLTTGSVANGATYIAGGLVPGSWALVKGSNLSSVRRIWADPDFVDLGNNLPTTLSGVQVKVNNLPAVVYYIDPGQITFQVPNGISGTASVQVFNNGQASNVVTGAAVTAAPGILPLIINGTNYPLGIFLDGKLAGDPSIGSGFRKAKPGENLQLYVTGLMPTPAGVLIIPQSVSGVKVTVGSITVDAPFAGLAGVGEFYINFNVPNLPDGAYAITVSVNGVSSPAAINSSPSGQLVLPIQH